MAAKKRAKEKHRVVHPPTFTSAEDWKRWIYPDYVSRKWKSLGLNDDDLRALEIAIMMNLKGAPVVKGTGGLRKARFARRGMGKSGSYRVGYIYFEEFGVVALLAVYAKNDQAEIPSSQRAAIKDLIEQMHDWILKSGY